MSASESSSVKELYEFGPFRVDAAKEVLLREGESVPLTPKTFQVLLVLIRHNQELVTKDELMKSVWPDSFVEETNLSRNIFMLRKALGESPQDHQYILTVPGRGYRFAEDVRLVTESELSIVAAHHSKVEVQVEKTKTWPWIALASIAMIVIAFGAFLFLRHPSIPLSAKDTVVLADFQNSTGDPVFDEALRQGLMVQLEQSPFLSLVPEQRIQHVLRLMGQSADTRLTPDLARQVCARTGSAAVLEGSIAILGEQYVVGLRARSCRNGDILDDELAQVAKKEDALSALSQIASRFRAHVGESLATIQKHDTPLAEATTRSLEALEAYSQAWNVHFRNGSIAALPLFKRATEIDPDFAMAHAALGRMYADLDESDLSAASITRAWQLREHTSARERFFINAEYEVLVSGNLEQARQTCESWAQVYPRDARPHILLSGYISKIAGQYESAAGHAQKGIELDPDFAIAYYNLAINQVYVNRPTEGENILSRAAGRGLEIDEFLMLDYDIAFLRGDEAGMKRAAVRARTRTGGDTWISNHEAFAAAYFGQMQQARNLTHRAVDQAEHADQRERAALWEAGAAVREAFFGYATEAQQWAAASLNLSRDREVEYGAALALARSGDVRRAEALVHDLERRFPEDTAVQFSYLPVLRAQMALKRGDAAQAIADLQSAVPYEFGVPRSSIHALFGALYPVYLRGEAYLAQHQGDAAAGEFQKIVDHPGITVSDPIGVLAYLQLGRAHREEGGKMQALSAYQRLLTLWKQADPDIPLYEQAKAETREAAIASVVSTK